MSLLQVEDLALDYRSHRGTVHALDGVSLSLSAGRVLGLVGESGCGKTSLARALTGVPPGNASITRGRILWQGQDLLALSESEHKARRWRDFAFVPQSAMNALNPVQRVSAQLMEVLRERGGLAQAQALARVDELFDQVGIDRKRTGDYPHQFSGGMRQRISIAMALALKPQLLIADEPVTALDVIVQRQILDLIVALRRQLQLSMIMVTHDVSVVAYVCDEVVVMYAGQVVEQGAVGQVLGSPLHPYTMGLTRAFPDLHQDVGTLRHIEGSPPDLRAPPSGCRFAPRCPFATDTCRQSPPPMVECDQGLRRVACWRADEAEVLRAQWSDALP
jgi:peptide/nickel transport system ATP-binding protein